MDADSAETPWDSADDNHQAHNHERSTEQEENTSTTVVTTLDPRPRAREVRPEPLEHAGVHGEPRSRTPIAEAIRAAVDPAAAARVYAEALTATRVVWSKGEPHEYPDWPVRLKAVDSITNRLEGMPAARVEHAGVVGLAALLAGDARDVI